MLFQVEMEVRIPPTIDEDVVERLKNEEREMALRLQREGKWRHLWRIAGRYANLSIFNVESAEELNTLLFALPLYPFMDVKVAALCQHPSALTEDE